MWYKILFFLLLTVVAVIWIKSRLWNRKNKLLVLQLWKDDATGKVAGYHSGVNAQLPDPVARYFQTVLPEGEKAPDQIYLAQSGQFLAGEQQKWRNFTADQHFTVRPPGFVWNASIKMLPPVNVRVIDSYHDGKGTLNARMLGAFELVNESDKAELNAGELMRYLAEAVWFPYALLPENGVRWEPVDAHRAQAILNHEGNEVSLRFHFDEANLIEKVEAEARYREENGRYVPRPWSGYFWNYQRHHGMLIPMDARVEWNLPQGNFCYWKGHIDKIEFSNN